MVDRIAEVEKAAYRSWPAREMVEHDGWQLRYADGFSRRGNSVYPARRSTIELAEKLPWCRDWYRARGLDLVIRQTPATEEGLDERLEAMGLSAEGRTNVMVGELAAGEISVPIADAATQQWSQATAALWKIKPVQRPAWAAIVDRIDLPAGFAYVAGSDGVDAVGIGVVDGEWLGLFEVIVAETSRRGGVGERVTRSLMEWGRRQGAVRSYLQVVEDNAAAVSLYQKVGFRLSYSYWYRRMSGH
ncbi:MAG: GNAT family N-acetyltransferase [bacterium]|nr:GNAT family N-acetyltransferase [bacterium]MCP4967155.1 GNAT family N-acetyltransferase [bacterium]